MLQYFSPLHTGVHLAKILGGLDLEHLGYNPAHSQRPCLGWEWEGTRSGLDRQSAEWDMKNVVCEKS